MEVRHMPCTDCSGRGKHRYFVDEGIIDCKCLACDGKGYAEYALFTPEEAQAILKYCGLATEGDELSEQ